MDKIFLKKCFYFIFVCVLINIAFCGCETQRIEFKRESEYNNTINNAKNSNNTQVTKSKNIYIYTYKDENNNKNKKQNAHFGPKDVNFDLPLKTH